MDPESDRVGLSFWITCAWLLTASDRLAAGCGYTFLPDQTFGIISSPNYPFNYKSPQSCNYTFLSASGDDAFRICFKFQRFDLGQNDCGLDYVEFPSGSRYCGKGRRDHGRNRLATDAESVWRSTFCLSSDPGGALILKFVTRSGNPSPGFYGHFTKSSYGDLGQDPECDSSRQPIRNRSVDCTNNQDPYCICADTVPCSKGEFTCFNRKCIPMSETCNRQDDCGDGSDETYTHARCHGRDLLNIDSLSCDFELDTCGLLGMSSWKRDSGYVLGPEEDHTIGRAGHYLRTDFDGQGTASSISFFTQSVTRFPREGLCLSFWYYVRSDNAGSDVAGDLHPGTGSVDGVLSTWFGSWLVWQTDIAAGAWHSASVFISHDESLRKSEYKIRFRAVRGRYNVSVMALDDIFLNKGRCQQVLEPSCTFERHLCGWSQNVSTGDQQKNGSSWRLENDGMSGRLLSLYVMSAWLPDLRSPYVRPVLADDYCFHFRLFTSSNKTHVIVVQEVWFGQVKVVWDGASSNMSGWRNVGVPVSTLEPFQVVLRIVYAETGDVIAIDDVAIVAGRCYNKSDLTLHQTVTGTPSSLSIGTILVLTSLPILILLVTVSLVFFCVILHKRASVPARETLTLTNQSLPSISNHVIIADQWQHAICRNYVGASKYQRNRTECGLILGSHDTASAFCIDGNQQHPPSNPPFIFDLPIQSSYRDPPPSYTSVVRGEMIQKDRTRDCASRNVSDIQSEDDTTYVCSI